MYASIYLYVLHHVDTVFGKLRDERTTLCTQIGINNSHSFKHACQLINSRHGCAQIDNRGGNIY